MIEETFSLTGDATPVLLEQSGITLVAPGLFGSGEAHPRPLAAGGRAALGEQDTIAAAIAESGGEDRVTLKLEAPTPRVTAGGRGPAGVADDEVQLQVPLAADEAAYLLYVDEAGVISLHLPEPITGSAPLPSRAVNAARHATYTIPLRSGESRTASGDGRGLFARITSKVIKVVVVKLLPGLVGGLVSRGVRAWEDHFRAHQGLHGGGWARLLDATPTLVEDLAPYNGKRALLLIHGTTSTTAGAFGKLALQPKLLDRLEAHYQGRILGFNHHTMGRSVAENVEELVRALSAAPGDYRFDIICHSRGGLLARALAATGAVQSLGDRGVPLPDGVQLAVDRIAFVATPNAGTAMAKADGIPALVERLTNVVNALPDSAGTIAAGGLLALAGAAVEAAMPQLPGLADQVPGSPLQRALGAAATADRWFALCSEFAPTGNLLDAVKRGATDIIFGGEQNDLVVPTAGVATTPFFALPPQRVVQFAPDRGVHHSAYFQQPEMARVIDWLTT